MGELLGKLMELNASGTYPFHIPGHKRNPGYPHFKEAFGLDITEIEGFGNLYSDRGILEDLKHRAAATYGAEGAFILLNGSTVGILSAISACTSRRGKLLMARNSHKSAYNAVYLNELESAYIYPPEVPRYSINGGISAEDVERALKSTPDAEAVFITSPTYDGIISDIEGIAKVCHDADKPLIVDSAHGAHLGFERDAALKYKADNAVNLRADVVIESLHKTLPSFTQTALMFVNGDRVDNNRLGEFLAIYQTSSPSYLFMAGISACLDFLETGEGTFKEYYEKLERLRDNLRGLNNFSLAGEEIIGNYNVFGLDISKLIISHERTSGYELGKILRSKYKLALEMSSKKYVLAVTSPMDTQEGFDRLYEALREIDDDI